MLITTKLLRSFVRKNVVFAILMLQLCVAFGQKKVIVIDPGHGGKDTGAIGINNIQEKTIVLNIANEIIKLNNTILDNRLDIYLTRYRDTIISLYDRTRLAKALTSDIFISLHCNASKTNANGMETYVHNSDKENTKASVELGIFVLDESTQKLGFKKRGVKFGDFQVLRETTLYPTILVEVGFVTNADEASYFLKPKNIKAIALAILMGITNYLNPEL